jgi:hypothetical protein
MDTGKILIGFAFIILSVALTVTPSSAHMPGHDAGNGAVFAAGTDPQADSMPGFALPAPAGEGQALTASSDQIHLP